MGIYQHDWKKKKRYTYPALYTVKAVLLGGAMVKGLPVRTCSFLTTITFVRLPPSWHS